jgi:fatty acid amide hydrolase 2
VKRLVEAGAIPVGVTNTSELTLWLESDNPLYGRTNNPYDLTRTAGGSSGGEGAAVGSGGSVFGVAADIGGSIRVPALFCGVFGHKPSAGLVPNTGLWPSAEGEAQRLLAVGPLSRRAEDLLPLLRIMAGPDGWDSRAVEMELGNPSEVSLDGLLVTVIEDSSYRPIARELRDARERAVGALASAGARVRRISLPSWRTALLPFLAALQDTASKSTRVSTLLSEAGESATSLPTLLFGRGRHTLPTRLTVLAEALPAGGATRAKLLARATELAAELTEAIGDGVLLHPAQLSLAPPHARTYGRPWITTPASIFNLAGVPVTEVPLGLTSRGLPVGVQVAAAHGADHLTIAIALELEAVFGGWVPPTL